jgi:hypothetical protein
VSGASRARTIAARASHSAEIRRAMRFRYSGVRVTWTWLPPLTPVNSLVGEFDRHIPAQLGHSRTLIDPLDPARHGER